MTVLNQGQTYIVTYTHPMYVKYEQRYLPDNFRFVDPEIMRGIYGGRVRNGVSCRCEICGRLSKDHYDFWDVERQCEVFFSPKCMEHESTRVWGQSTDPQRIQDWYQRRSLEDGAKRGDPLAGLALALEEMEGGEWR